MRINYLFILIIILGIIGLYFEYQICAWLLPESPWKAWFILHLLN
jgi:hypothetical protein